MNRGRNDLRRIASGLFSALGRRTGGDRRRGAMAAPREQRVERSFSRSFDSIDEVFRFLEELVGADRLQGADRYAVRFVVEELITNMVKHQPDGGAEFVVEAAREEQRLRVCFTEPDVEPFDITEAPEARTDLPLEEREPGGLGIHLLRKMVDHLEYDYADRCGKTAFVRTLSEG